jgi:tRNA nucleotidyltransferase (CCA-adding enzyme)
VSQGVTTENPYRGELVLERLGGLPGGKELLSVAARHPDIELVGGAVRDLLLGLQPRELDAIAGTDVGGVADELAALLGGQATRHERFGTAVVRSEGVDVDLARIRSERYPAPGALPEVADGTPAEDLARRDFTVNALAVPLAGERRGQLRSVAGALEDLAARRLRVLHEQSFVDDPTRILRLARYAARLRFAIEPRTEALASAALAAGALRTVSAQRLGAELRLALGEADPPAALGELERLGVLAAWMPGLGFQELAVRAALEILPADGSRRILLAASLSLGLQDAAKRMFLAALELPAGEAERGYLAALQTVLALERIDRAETTDGLLELVGGAPVESLALAAGIRERDAGPGTAARRTVERWFAHQRHVKLHITGEDLLAAGVPQGAELGLRLRRAYRMLLDGRIPAEREAELRAALETSL